MQLSRRALGAAAAAIAVTLTACGNDQATPSGPTIDVTHAQGTAKVPATVNKVVVLDFGALDTVAALGLADKVVGLPKTNIPAPLKQFADDRYADVGTLAEPNLEAINKLKPDLVIIGFRSAKHHAALAQHFPTIDVTYAYTQNFVDGVEKAATIVATALGKADQVPDKVAAIKKSLEAAKARFSTGTTAMVLMTTAGKVTVHGKDSRYGAIFRDLGLTPAIPEVKEASHGDPISFEAIKKANPQVMFVLDRDAAVGEEGKAAAEVLDNELVATTDAWRNKQVVYLDGARWYIMIHGLDNALAMAEGLTTGL
ncbi:siderophore ABC transporter substrate-binding protein [Aestuariimicrobium ganziense]|uniref:siderophore ABC transporter substrate-binding protein n=1 Tax=Aestuariimicrobium ganziense TaxID=2773677 RepID=UPI001944241D|nr:ABC transporter substrate-binding protein [Aestuariimicrobium ganziense]